MFVFFVPNKKNVIFFFFSHLYLCSLSLAKSPLDDVRLFGLQHLYFCFALATEQTKKLKYFFISFFFIQLCDSSRGKTENKDGKKKNTWYAFFWHISEWLLPTTIKTNSIEHRMKSVPLAYGKSFWYCLVFDAFGRWRLCRVVFSVLPVPLHTWCIMKQFITVGWDQVTHVPRNFTPQI